MLLSLFPTLYELIIGKNPDYPEYGESIFNSVGILSFIISIVICLIFYVGLGRWKPVYHKIHHWIITIIVVAGIGFGLAFTQAKGVLDFIDSYLIQFALFNAVFSALYFIIFSFFFKRFSIYSKNTP